MIISRYCELFLQNKKQHSPTILFQVGLLSILDLVNYLNDP